MTFVFQNPDRAKKAAQRIAKALPGVKLSAVQEGVARSLGYVDGFAFEHATPRQAPSPLDQQLSESDFRARVDRQIIVLASHLGVPDGDVQYALASARLTGDRTWSFPDHLALRVAAWKRGPLSAARPRGRGDLVRIKSSGRSPEFGYLLSYGPRSARVLLDDSTLTCATFEVVRPRQRPADFIPARYWRPYGYWTLEDDSKVFFSRDYFPLWRAGPDGVERLAPWLWIGPRKAQTHFFIQTGEANWLYPRARALSEAALAEHGVQGLPILADAALRFFDGAIEHPEEAVDAEFKRRGAPTDAPAFAVVRDLAA